MDDDIKKLIRESEAAVKKEEYATQKVLIPPKEPLLKKNLSQKNTTIKAQYISIGVKVLVGLFIIILIGMFQSPISKKSENGSGIRNTSISIGEEGILAGTGGTLTPVAITETALDEFIKSKIANDKDGIVQMIVAGSIFTVNNGTKVLIIDYGDGMFKRKIRILEGAMKGRAGYVPYEWIK
jgi:hypothetical protein